MTACSREAEIVRALTSNDTRPLSAELQEHLHECHDCREALVVSRALLGEDEAAEGLPTADMVWFRAQLRARAEAASVVARPVLLAQAVAGASAVGAVVAVTGALAGLEVVALATRGLLLAFALWLLLAPVAVYVATIED